MALRIAFCSLWFRVCGEGCGIGSLLQYLRDRLPRNLAADSMIWPNTMPRKNLLITTMC